MLEVIRNDKGNIICACEWRKLNYNRQYDKDGKIIYVKNIEVSKDYQNNGAIKQLIRIIYNKMPYFEHAYFKRSKYKNRVRAYPRNFWLRLIGERI